MPSRKKYHADASRGALSKGAPSARAVELPGIVSPSHENPQRQAFRGICARFLKALLFPKVSPSTKTHLHGFDQSTEKILFRQGNVAVPKIQDIRIVRTQFVNSPVSCARVAPVPATFNAVALQWKSGTSAESTRNLDRPFTRTVFQKEHRSTRASAEKVLVGEVVEQEAELRAHVVGEHSGRTAGIGDCHHLTS